MKSICVISILLFSIIFILPSQTKAADGKITPELLENLEKSINYNGPWRALYNALIQNDIKKLALDFDKLEAHNDDFNHEIGAKGVTSQKSSGRCWLFSSLNMLRPVMITKYDLDEFEFSQNYLSFYDKFEKANYFLEMIIELRERDLLDRELQLFFDYPWGDGGWWSDFVGLIEKYGCVPKEAMSETHNSNSTSMMNKLVKQKLREYAMDLREMHWQGKTVQQMRESKQEMLQDIYKILTMNLGIPPKKFTWTYEKDSVEITKEYTPHEFYKDIVGVDVKNYVPLMDNPTRPYFKYYEGKYNTNMYGRENDKYINVPVDTLVKYTWDMLADSQAVVFTCDVGKENANGEGIFQKGIYDYESIYGIEFESNKSERLSTFDITSNHMMLIIACDTANAKVEKWKVENSWGSDRGNKGFWSMYPEWFDEYVFQVVVDKKLLSDDLLQILKTDPVLLPMWDPYAVSCRK